MHPLNSRCNKTWSYFLVGFIWLMGISLSSIQFVHGRAVKFEWDGQELYDCTEEWNDTDGKVYTVVIFTLTFLLPMIVLTYTYSTVGWKMWRHTSPGNADPTRDQQQFQAKVKVVKMLAIVVLLFAACWLPIQILNLLLYFLKDELIPNSDDEYYGYIAAFFSCHWLSMANSFVNPIIYCFMSDNFRADLKQFVYCCWPEFSSKTNCRCMGGGFNSTRTSSFHSTSTVVLGNTATFKTSTKQIDIILSKSKKGRPAVVHYTVDDT